MQLTQHICYTKEASILSHLGLCAAMSFNSFVPLWFGTVFSSICPLLILSLCLSYALSSPRFAITASISLLDLSFLPHQFATGPRPTHHQVIDPCWTPLLLPLSGIIIIIKAVCWYLLAKGCLLGICCFLKKSQLWRPSSVMDRVRGFKCSVPLHIQHILAGALTICFCGDIESASVQSMNWIVLWHSLSVLRW